MATAKTKEKFDSVITLRMAVNVLTESANAQDLCRRATHSEYFQGMCRGVAIYLLDKKSALLPAAGYGDIPDEPQTPVSAWDDHFLALSVRSRAISYQHAEAGLRACLPIEIAGVVIGAMSFTFSPEYSRRDPKREDSRLVSNLVGLFMDTKGLHLAPRTSYPGGSAVPEEITAQEMTTRQVRILQYVADGMTNAEISKHVLLSESTVRQETIRIFRILKCHTRTEAIVKARSMGIIERVQQNTRTSP